MNNKKATKRALLTSITALAMCVVMLAGTTFAWFTDTASTSVNKIQAGTLDVKLEMSTDGTNWTDAEGQTLNFVKTDASGSKTANTAVLWEPGCTYELPQLRISNNGNLALKYKVQITGINASQGGAKLNEVITWTITNDGTPTGGSEYKLDAKSGDTVDSDILTISGTMATSAGNEYQGLTIDGVGITVYATQVEHEYDSKCNNYDMNADYPIEIVSEIREAAMTAEKDATGEAVTQYTYANSDTTVKATVPADAVATDANGNKLTPSISIKPTTVNTEADTAIKATGKDAIAYDIKVENLKANNTDKVTVEVYVGKNLGGVVVYHNGTAMNTGDYSYNSESGMVTISTASFSTFSIAYDAPIALGRDEASYTLDEFNALTEIPEGVKTVYLKIGDVSLANGSVVIGNDNLRDKYERKADGESKGEYTYTEKDGINLVIYGGTVKDGPAVDSSVANKIAFKIPDKSTVTFKNVKIEGFFGLSGATADNPYGSVMPHQIASVTFDGCTFDALWLQNGGFGTSQITIKNSTFNEIENSVESGNTNPLWFVNIGQNGGTNISIDNCTFNTNRPVKVVEQKISGQTVSITNCTFNMQADSDNKNAAIMFSTTSDGSTLGNVVISGNKVNGGVALLTFYSDPKIAMADGATFTVSGNTLGTGVKTSVVWKSATEYKPDFVTVN